MTIDSNSRISETRSFQFFLPIDPCRILLGIRQKWYWFLLLAGIGCAAGVITGFVKAESRYSVSLQLLRAEVPGSVQASQEGTSFKPRELSDETLLAVTYSNEVLNAVGNDLDPRRPGSTVKATIEINKQRGTDFFYLTAHSRIGAEDAIAIVKAWAREIVVFTRELQRREARDMYAFLDSQRREISVQLAEVSKEILAFSEKSEFYDAEKQTESYLASLENLQMKQAEAQIELQSKAIQIERYREELRNQSPLFEELRNLEKELTFLQGRYTVANPLVKEKLYEISFLRERIEELKTGDTEDLKEFTGSDLGNNLYLEILSLENERTQLSKVEDSYISLIEKKRSQVAALPKMQMNLTELNGRRQQSLTTLSLLNARMKEAEFYINNPPGYWKIFQTPELREVVVSSQPVKALGMGMAGLVLGGLVAFLISLFWELGQDRIRSPLQAAILTRSRPILHAQFCNEAQPSVLEKWRIVRERSAPDPGPELLRFWLTEMARSGPPYPSVFFLAIDPVPQVLEFWKCFLEVVDQDDVPVVLLPLAEKDRDVLPVLPVFDGQAKGSYCSDILLAGGPSPEKSLAELRDKAYAMVVTTERLRPREFNLLKDVERVYVMVAPEVTTRAQARLKADVIRTIRGSASGVILLSPVLRRTIPRLLYGLQMTFLNNQTRNVEIS